MKKKNSCLIERHLIESLMTLESLVVSQQFIRTGHVLRLDWTYFLGRLTGFRRVVYYSTHPACNCYKISPHFLKPSFNLMLIRVCVVPNIARGATQLQLELSGLYSDHKVQCFAVQVCLCVQARHVCVKKRKNNE